MFFNVMFVSVFCPKMGSIDGRSPETAIRSVWTSSSIAASVVGAGSGALVVSGAAAVVSGAALVVAGAALVVAGASTVSVSAPHALNRRPSTTARPTTNLVLLCLSMATLLPWSDLRLTVRSVLRLVPTLAARCPSCGLPGGRTYPDRHSYRSRPGPGAAMWCGQGTSTSYAHRISWSKRPMIGEGGSRPPRGNTSLIQGCQTRAW